MIQKRKQFPFFSLPAPKFLTKNIKKIDDFVVLVRVTPKITVFNYIDSVLYPLLFICTFVSLIGVFAGILLSRAGPLLLTFLEHYWWALVISFFTGYTFPPPLQNYVAVFWFTLGCFIAMLWSAAQVRRTFREFRGLRQLHTMPQAERKEFLLDRFVHISLPFWLSPSVSYEPTPEDLLKVLREREQATEELTQAIASTLEDDEQKQEDEQEEQLSVSMLLTLTHNASLSLLAPGNKQATVELTDAVIPLVGFLATCTRGSWITKEEIFKRVYDPGKESAFAMHRKRANTQVITRAREAGIFPIKEREDMATDEQPVSEADTAAKIELFNNQIQGQVSSWQLTSECNIEIFPFLTDFYRKVVEAQALPLADAPDALSLEQLRQGCHRVMEEYGEGFLASHMKKGYIWSWALPLYQKYRKQCLYVLAYANQRDREYLETCQTRSEKYVVVEHIAQFYGWQAMVATGLDLKDGGVSSELDMERSLIYYSRMKKKSAARAAYQSYCELRSRIDPTYEPSKALNARAVEVLSSKGKVARNHKSEEGAS